MSNQLDFAAEDFAAMPVGKQIEICKLLASRAGKMAALAAPPMLDSYVA